MTTIPTYPGLTERESRFVQAILDGCTRTEAARRAGYGSTYESQRVQGSRLMRRAKIIEALRQARAEKDGDDATWNIMGHDEMLGRLSDTARHGETDRLRLDALKSLAGVHGREQVLRLEKERLLFNATIEDLSRRMGLEMYGMEDEGDGDGDDQ